MDFEEKIIDSYPGKTSELFVEKVETRFGTFYKVILSSPTGAEFIGYARRETRATAFAYRKYAEVLAQIAYFQDQAAHSLDGYVTNQLRPKSGSLVRAKEGCEPLVCGSGVYPLAVVITTEPFVMVSIDTFMKWTNYPIENVEVIGTADPLILANCISKRGGHGR